VLPLPDVLDLFADELAGLGGRGLSLSLVTPRALDRPLFWHGGTFSREA
jgi:hypothetical protein